MEGFVGLVYLIVLVWGVLNIFLFFKIWSMTNDVKNIKKEFCEENLVLDTQLASYVKKNLILGKKEIVKEALLRNFIRKVVLYTNGNDSIRPYVDNLKKQFDKIGEEVPDYIERLQTYNDYDNLFTAADFKV
jgi:hypothetical protein